MYKFGAMAAAAALVSAVAVPSSAALAEEAAPARPAPSGAAAANQPELDRKAILAIIAEPMASAYMREAGRKAIADGPAAMRRFLEVDQHKIRIDDYTVRISRLLAGAGPGLKEGILALLKKDPGLAELRDFHDVTQYTLRDVDNRVIISGITAHAGPVLRPAALKALKGSPDDRTYFLSAGRYTAQAQDDRAALKRLAKTSAGPRLAKAIRDLLGRAASPSELRTFLEVTQFELRDADAKARPAKR
ncbi:ALF repeat-containing protein [Streptomyces sp. NPDC089919]|uniref:ALF repeat-containing protein n=1 Tax=Streptomyces sp. NPDC089919 TaxID=3155188 RepID=UPI0034429B35